MRDISTSIRKLVNIIFTINLSSMDINSIGQYYMYASEQKNMRFSGI